MIVDSMGLFKHHFGFSHVFLSKYTLLLQKVVFKLASSQDTDELLSRIEMV